MILISIVDFIATRRNYGDWFLNFIGQPLFNALETMLHSLT